MVMRLRRYTPPLLLQICMHIFFLLRDIIKRDAANYA